MGLGTSGGNLGRRDGGHFAWAVLGLLRPQQWYKNLVVFIAIVFAGGLAQADLLARVASGFASLCLVSSAGYAINDIVDVGRDQSHPEKRHRPLPSGEISVGAAAALALVLLCAGLAVASALGGWFFISVVALFALMQAYSFFIKSVAFADVLLIATNFAVRAVAGAVVISVPFSSWLVLCTFLVGLFLALSKRYAEASNPANAQNHRKALSYYTPGILSHLLIISTTMLLLAYNTYIFTSPVHSALSWATAPVAMFIVFRFCYKVYAGDEIAQKPVRIFLDQQSVIGIAAWLAIILVDVYFRRLFPWA